jgi:hypothetical protein
LVRREKEVRWWQARRNNKSCTEESEKGERIKPLKRKVLKVII